MVFYDNLVVSTLVIKAKVVAKEGGSFDFRRVKTKEVDFRVVLNLDLFIVSHSLVLEELKSLSTRHWEGYLVDADG